jgi:glycerol-3-phosphate acyltransferase PlsY
VPEKFLIEYYIVVWAFVILAIFRHKENIGRLVHGTERKLSFGKNKK